MDIEDDTAKLAAEVRSGDRAALGRAITLIESKRPDHERTAQSLLHVLLPHSLLQRADLTHVEHVLQVVDRLADAVGVEHLHLVVALGIADGNPH